MPLVTVRIIEEAVEKFLNSKTESAEGFPVSELIQAVNKSLKVPASDKDNRHRTERECEMILASHSAYFCTERKDGLFCHSKAAFFRGCEFKITPNAFEIEQGILLPGARFAPYCSEDVFPDDYEIYADASDEPLPIKKISAKFEDVSSPFIMLGRAGFVDYLVAESEKNYQTLRNSAHIEKESVDLSVFDTKAFYKKHSFKPGDALILTVTDWNECSFGMKYVPQSELPDAIRQEEWITDFETALLRVCEREANYQEIPEQLSDAYLFAFEDGNDLRRKPYLAIDEYRYKMREISIKRDESDWLLVPTDELREPGADLEIRQDHEHVHSENCSCQHEREDENCACGHKHHTHEKNEYANIQELDDDIRTHTSDGNEIVKNISSGNFSASAGTLDSIEAILAEIGAPLDYIEIFAFISDAIANGEENFNVFYSRLQELMQPKFIDEAQEVTFQNYLEEVWESCVEYYNPSIDAAKFSLRSVLLDLTTQRIEVSARLLEKYGKNIPSGSARKLKALHRQIIETLSMLNSESALPEGEDYEQLELRIGDIEEQWELFLENPDI